MKMPPWGFLLRGSLFKIVNRGLFHLHGSPPFLFNVLSESLCAWFCEMIFAGCADDGKSATRAGEIPGVHHRREEKKWKT